VEGGAGCGTGDTNEDGGDAVSGDSLLRQLTEFFKTARHLWGRCPSCGQLFRLSDAAISYGSEAPKDWLRKIQQQQRDLAAKKGELDDWQADLDGKEYDLQSRERGMTAREQNIHREAKALAQQLMKDDKAIKPLLKQATQNAIQRSRATLLGKLFERLGPFFQRFNHDPRDIRAIMDPIDYVCFDGLTVNRQVERITFVEVKSGTSEPSPTQRSIIRAVQEGRVATEVWHFGERGVPIPQQLRTFPGIPKALPARPDDPGRRGRR